MDIQWKVVCYLLSFIMLQHYLYPLTWQYFAPVIKMFLNNQDPDMPEVCVFLQSQNRLQLLLYMQISSSRNIQVGWLLWFIDDTL